jgi:hypothetical protein
MKTKLYTLAGIVAVLGIVIGLSGYLIFLLIL